MNFLTDVGVTEVIPFRFSKIIDDVSLSEGGHLSR